MSWNLEIPIMVRTLINDLSDDPTYSDERIQQAIVVAAKYVKFDVTLENEYTIDVTNPDITPDPTVGNDDIFITLVSLKAACIIDQSTLRTKSATEGIRAALGPANISVAGSLSGIKTILEKGPCASYDHLANSWNIREASYIRAVLSPFVGNNFDPSSLNQPGGFRRDLYS